MFQIMVRSQEFEGLTKIKQHRLVTETLREEIGEIHGLTIHTETP